MSQTKTAKATDALAVDVSAKLGETAETEAVVETVSATEFKNRLGSFLQSIARDPIVIEKSGKQVAVLLSYDEYDRLVHYEDYFWAEKARKAEETEEWIGPEETMKFLLSAFQPDEDAED